MLLVGLAVSAHRSHDQGSVWRTPPDRRKGTTMPQQTNTLPSVFGNPTTQTMSSREIAELCEKRHGDVIRDIRVMLDALKDDADLRHVRETKDARGYTAEIHLDRDLTMNLITGYNPVLRLRVIKRLAEYEAGARLSEPGVIDMRDAKQLRLAAIQLIEMNQEKDERIAELAPKAEALDRLETSEGSVGVRLAAKMLSMPERKFTAWLQAQHWAFRQNGIGPLQAYVDKRDRGYLEHRPHTYRDQVTGHDRTIAQMMVTPKGLRRIAVLLGVQLEEAA